MGMSMYLCGIKPPDDDWKKMKAVWDACAAGDIEPPGEVSGFFGDEVPDDSGVLVELGWGDGGAPSDGEYGWSNEDAVGFEVDITALPKDIKKLRFYCSW